MATPREGHKSYVVYLPKPLAKEIEHYSVDEEKSVAELLGKWAAEGFARRHEKPASSPQIPLPLASSPATPPPAVAPAGSSILDGTGRNLFDKGANYRILLARIKDAKSAADFDWVAIDIETMKKNDRLTAAQAADLTALMNAELERRREAPVCRRCGKEEGIFYSKTLCKECQEKGPEGPDPEKEYEEHKAGELRAKDGNEAHPAPEIMPSPEELRRLAGEVLEEEPYNPTKHSAGSPRPGQVKAFEKFVKEIESPNIGLPYLAVIEADIAEALSLGRLMKEQAQGLYNGIATRRQQMQEAEKPAAPPVVIREQENHRYKEKRPAKKPAAKPAPAKKPARARK